MAIAQILSLALLFLAAVLSLLFLFNASLHRRRDRPAEKEIRPQEALIALPQPPATPPEVLSEEKLAVEDGEQRGRKRRGRKNKQGSDGGKGEACRDVGKDEKAVRKDGKDGLDDCMYPFSSSASATQRKIKLQYDQLVKSNHSKSLTMNQVGQFVNCLVEARNELQHKSDIIQRSFKIKKALLFKAERSSFDRLCQQLYKLEAEHRRLEEDAAVYNLLQEQLKLSPAYKTMLEIGTSMELKDKLDQPTDFPDISFEELLAQEKKDSFWLRNGKLRTSTS